MKDKKCFECGEKASHNHHVVPRSLGGTKTIPLCHNCHGLAHGKKGLQDTAELTRLAMKKKKEAGLRIGDIPFGFSLQEDKKTLTKNEYEQKIILEVLDLANQSFSIRKICRYLTHLRYKPRGEKWNSETIRRIIKNNGK
jgi:hypothetical protein